MNFGGTAGPAQAIGIAKRIPRSFAATLEHIPFRNAIQDKATILYPLVTVVALGTGILLGAISQGLSGTVNTTANTMIDAYSYGAPVLIFVVLAPVLSRIFSTRRTGKFGLYVVGWLAVTKVLAMLWAVVFTVAVFGLPIVSDDSASVGAAISETLNSLVNTLTVSQYFWAVYAAIGAGLLAIKVRLLADVLEKGVSMIEHLGQYIQPVVPIFMITIGIYLQSLPSQLEGQIGEAGTLVSLEN